MNPSPATMLYLRIYLYTIMFYQFLVFKVLDIDVYNEYKIWVKLLVTLILKNDKYEYLTKYKNNIAYIIKPYT